MRTNEIFRGNYLSQEVSLVKAEKDQSNVLKNIAEYNNKSRPKTKEGSRINSRSIVCKTYIFINFNLLS